MAQITLSAQVVHAPGQQLVARITAGGNVSSVNVQGGAFVASVIAPNAASPTDAELATLLPVLDAVAPDEPTSAQLFLDLGSASSRNVERALRLHALSQGQAFLEFYGDPALVAPRLNASIELFSPADPTTILSRRSLFLGPELDGDTLGLRFLDLIADPQARVLTSTTADAWHTKMAELWQALQGPAPAANDTEVPLHRISRGSPQHLANALAGGDWSLHAGGKFPHRHGVVGLVTWTPAPGHPFTGVLAKGAQGIVRLGSGIHNARYQIPGLALKIPVTGRRSLDILALYRAEGQGADLDFFRNTLHTRVPPIGQAASSTPAASKILELLQVELEKRSRKVLADQGLAGEPRRLPVDHLAEVTQDGAVEASPFAPFELDFVPTPAVRAAFPSPQKIGDVPLLSDALAAIPAGTPLYSVLGFERDETLGDECWELGTLRLDGTLIASESGDQFLHFTHHFPPAP